MSDNEIQWAFPSFQYVITIPISGVWQFNDGFEYSYLGFVILQSFLQVLQDSNI